MPTNNIRRGSAGNSTVESNTNSRSGWVQPVAHVLHVWRTTIVGITNMDDADGALVAAVSQTQSVKAAES